MSVQFIISLLAILSGIFVIIAKNPIVSVVFLISLFINVACYLMLIGIHFVGLSYLLIYVGAISILFLFTIMLINIRISELHWSSAESMPLGFLVSIAFFYPVYSILPSSNPKGSDFGSNFDIQYVTSSKWDAALAQVSDISAIGNIMYSSHAIWLILAGSILLLAMLGAIIVTVQPEKVYISASTKIPLTPKQS